MTTRMRVLRGYFDRGGLNGLLRRFYYGKLKDNKHFDLSNGGAQLLQYFIAASSSAIYSYYIQLNFHNEFLRKYT